MSVYYLLASNTLESQIYFCIRDHYNILFFYILIKSQLHAGYVMGFCYALCFSLNCKAAEIVKCFLTAEKRFKFFKLVMIYRAHTFLLSVRHHSFSTKEKSYYIVRTL